MKPAPRDADKTPGFSWTVRIYYEDTDAGGIVYYANYLKFFERARTEWLRSLGIGLQALTQSQRIAFVVKSIAVEYHAPARLDDELNLTVAVERLGRASVHLIQEAWRVSDGEQCLLASGRIRLACVESLELRPSPIPEDVLKKIDP